jgi:hypothetical protein
MAGSVIFSRNTAQRNGFHVEPCIFFEFVVVAVAVAVSFDGMLFSLGVTATAIVDVDIPAGLSSTSLLLDSS